MGHYSCCSNVIYQDVENLVRTFRINSSKPKNLTNFFLISPTQGTKALDVLQRAWNGRPKHMVFNFFKQFGIPDPFEITGFGDRQQIDLKQPLKHPRQSYLSLFGQQNPNARWGRVVGSYLGTVMGGRRGVKNGSAGGIRKAPCKWIENCIDRQTMWKTARKTQKINVENSSKHKTTIRKIARNS